MNSSILPRISVITVVFNNASHIDKTIRSVISQSYSNLEYIIIDGGSTDGTLDIVNRYVSFLSSFVSEPDNGIYDAMNKGLRVATGDYINFMNSGDCFASPTVVSEIAEQLAQRQVGLIYGAANLIYKNYRVTYNPKFDLVKKSYAPCHQAAFTKITVLRKLGHFDTSYRLSADLNFFANFFSSDYSYTRLNTIIADFQSGGVSSDKTILYREQYKIIRKYFGRIAAARFYLHKIVIEQGIKKLLDRLGFQKTLELLIRKNNLLKRQ